MNVFKGIGVVLPLKNEMKTPQDLFGYLKYGDLVNVGSFTLNLPLDEMEATSLVYNADTAIIQDCCVRGSCDCNRKLRVGFHVYEDIRIYLVWRYHISCSHSWTLIAPCSLASQCASTVTFRRSSSSTSMSASLQVVNKITGSVLERRWAIPWSMQTIASILTY